LCHHPANPPYHGFLIDDERASSFWLAAIRSAHARLEGNEHGWLSAWAERIAASQKLEARSSSIRNP
jgi:hypothetical protein